MEKKLGRLEGGIKVTLSERVQVRLSDLKIGSGTLGVF
jgi:hypothetical protein